MERLAQTKSFGRMEIESSQRTKRRKRNCHRGKQKTKSKTKK